MHACSLTFCAGKVHENHDTTYLRAQCSNKLLLAGHSIGGHAYHLYALQYMQISISVYTAQLLSDFFKRLYCALQLCNLLPLHLIKHVPVHLMSLSPASCTAVFAVQHVPDMVIYRLNRSINTLYRTQEYEAGYNPIRMTQSTQIRIVGFTTNAFILYSRRWSRSGDCKCMLH